MTKIQLLPKIDADNTSLKESSDFRQSINIPTSQKCLFVLLMLIIEIIIVVLFYTKQQESCNITLQNNN